MGGGGDRGTGSNSGTLTWVQRTTEKARGHPVLGKNATELVEGSQKKGAKKKKITHSGGRNGDLARTGGDGWKEWN